MYIDYSLNAIICREKFSLIFLFSAQNSGWGRVFMNAFRQLRPARGRAGRNGDFICRWGLAGGVRGDGGAADDYLVATENHVDEC